MQNHFVPGTPMGGGFYAGQLRIGDNLFALIVASKAEGEREDVRWHKNYDAIPGALSYCDGLANTNAMLEAGSPLAEWVRGLRIGEFDDWYLPSQDELEILYRNLKPTADENSLYGRSGINLSSTPPTRPYTEDSPAQTACEAFQEGGDEAFDSDWYWSSTQHAGDSDCAWFQSFGYGDQNDYRKDFELRARAVRRLPI